MTTEFGFCFRSNSDHDSSSGVLHLWIRHRGKMRFVPTTLEVRHEEWDPVQGMLIISDDFSGRRRKLTAYAKRMNRALRLVESIVSDLKLSRRKFSVDDIANAYITAVSALKMLGVYAAVEAVELNHSGQTRSIRAYMTAVRRFIAFNDGCDIEMSSITPEMMSAFQQLLMVQKVSRNTISFYMRTLRAIYNKASIEGIIPPRLDSPFEEVYTDVVVNRRN